jgi:hypothetical protein
MVKAGSSCFLFGEFERVEFHGLELSQPGRNNIDPTAADLT